MQSPSEIRDEVHRELRVRFTGERERVHSALLRLGPRTVRELALVMEWDLNSVAPRVTELVQLGLATLSGRDGRRGVYMAISWIEAVNRLADARIKARMSSPQQMVMPL